jgi:Ser/Thr protein kinase RdoA (MazF antagonist)
MTEMRELSRLGRLRRLRSLADQALEEYDLENPQLTYHGFETNLLYRVVTANGDRYVLRLASPGWRSYTDLCSEAAWLDALARDTSIPVPTIQRASSGEQVLKMTSDGVGGHVWNTSLMRWVPGRDLGHFLTDENLCKMGRLFAQLHKHGAEWKPPEGFTTRRFEHWLSRGEENRILDGADGSIPGVPARLIDSLHEHVENAYKAVDRSDLRVIHCDLWHNNIRLHRGTLHPLDFEDTVWGFRAHDIAMAMLDLLEDTDDDRYQILLAAFRTGYEELLTWPEERIEPFQIGRLLWKINWVARHESEWLKPMATKHVGVFEHYLKTGAVLKPPGWDE